MVSIIESLRSQINEYRLKKKKQALGSYCTFQGQYHQVALQSKIKLHCGSNRQDVVLCDHSELFGNILSYNHGKVIVGKWAKIGYNSTINCVNSITIGADTAIANNVTIVDHNFHPINPDDRRYMRHTPHGALERQPMYSSNAPIVIGENVWIGANVRICKGVTIGDNSVIGANSIVTKSIPANSVAVGNPAHVVKSDIDKTTTPVFPL